VNISDELNCTFAAVRLPLIVYTVRRCGLLPCDAMQVHCTARALVVCTTVCLSLCPSQVEFCQHG